jgi:C1A family cysteine protease
MDVPEKQAFLCPNSWGTDRGEDWYFYLPYSEIKNIYTKLVIFDKDDSGLFLKIKEKSQAMEWVRQLKKIYAITQLPLNDKKLCKSLADSLRIIYWFTDKDL